MLVHKVTQCQVSVLSLVCHSLQKGQESQRCQSKRFLKKKKGLCALTCLFPSFSSKSFTYFRAMKLAFIG